MKNIIKSIVTILLFLLSINHIYFAQTNTDSIRIVNEALQMIKFPAPEFSKPYATNPTPKEIADMGFEQLYQAKSVQYEMRDGIKILGQKFERTSNKIILLIHGTLASSYTYNKMAGLLRESLQAEVIAIDLRGHGQSGGVPGDVSTLNQYAEDLEDIISKIKTDTPNKSLILTGHSMGGGIILRYSETFPQAKVDGYLLFAPNLGTDSPTSNKELDFKNNLVKMHLSRGLGLYMLNQLGIHDYDSLKVVFYNLPKQMPLRSYSYRSMQASTPTNYRKALRKINKPMLILAGSEDEVFIAEEYRIITKAYSQGECHLVDGETHNGIRHNKEAMKRVSRWVIENNL